MESVALKQVNSIIICEPERRAQLPDNLPTEPIVMRNIPSFNSRDFLHNEEKFIFDNDNITVSYVGWFGHGRFINELLNCAEQGFINLLIAGYGQNSIENRCQLLASNHIIM